MKIKATIESNDRKYYGTEIKLVNEAGDEAFFQVWINGIGDYTPSEREIDFVDKDGKYWCLADDGETYEYEISDDHYETQAAYLICQKIVEAIDGMEISNA